MRDYIYFSDKMMEKDFDNWNKQKKVLENNNKKVLFKEGEIWRTAVGINIATESCGKGNTFRRPVLIFKKLSQYACIVIPLTSKPKNGTWFSKIEIHNKNSRALLYQIRNISSNRFQRRLAVLDDNDFLHIKEKLKQLLELL